MVCLLLFVVWGFYSVSLFRHNPSLHVGSFQLSTRMGEDPSTLQTDWWLFKKTLMNVWIFDTRGSRWIWWSLQGISKIRLQQMYANKMCPRNFPKRSETCQRRVYSACLLRYFIINVYLTQEGMFRSDRQVGMAPPNFGRLDLGCVDADYHWERPARPTGAAS